MPLPVGLEGHEFGAADGTRTRILQGENLTAYVSRLLLDPGQSRYVLVASPGHISFRFAVGYEFGGECR